MSSEMKPVALILASGSATNSRISILLKATTHYAISEKSEKNKTIKSFKSVLEHFFSIIW